MNIQRIDLDISKPDAIAQTVTIGQGDKGGTTIEASIYDNGMEVSLSGKSAMLEVRLPDGKSYVRDVNCTVSDNKITYTVDEEHVGAVAGVTDEAYFDVLDGPTVIYSTNRFRLRILRSAHDGAQPAEDWDNALDALIERGDAALDAYDAAESARATAETARVSAETSRQGAEDDREDAEDARAAAESARATAETARASAEGSRANAESARATAESARATAETSRASAETTRQSAEDARETAQEQNDSAQHQNDLDQLKNNADQAINNQAAQGIISVVLGSGQYDQTTRKPTITGEIGKIYLVPKTDETTTDHYLEWMWLDSSWEQIGTTQTTIEGITTEEIDAVVDGEGGTGNQTLNLTGLNYLWAKEVDYFDDNYSGISTKATTGPAYGPLTSVTANGHAEQDGTPTPSDPREIVVVRGRNLFGAALNKVLGGNAAGGFTLVGGGTSFMARVTKNTTYTIRDHSAQAGNRFRIVGFVDEPSATATTDATEIYNNGDANPRQYTFNSGASNWVVLSIDNSTYYSDAIAQLELGSTAHPYVPYGCVGLDVTANGKTTTTPIPLPSRGWVGSLPDGTHDALTIDGAGRYEWAVACGGVELSTLSWSWQPSWATWYTGYLDYVKPSASSDVVANVRCETLQAAKSGSLMDGSDTTDDAIAVLTMANPRILARNGSTSTAPTGLLLYELATPTTEHGYIDLPDIPEGAVVSVPELEGMVVKSWTGDAVADYTSAVVGKVEDSVSLKTMQLTKTTTASGIFGTGLMITNAVVYAFRTDLAYRCIPYLATDGYWNVIVLKPQVAQEAAANVSVSGTVYYI